jgi:hypothetical protein
VGRIVNLSTPGESESPCSPHTRRPRGVFAFIWALAASRSLALVKEVGRDGITVNAVSAGATKTHGSAKLIEDWGGEEGWFASIRGPPGRADRRDELLPVFLLAWPHWSPARSCGSTPATPWADQGRSSEPGSPLAVLHTLRYTERYAAH